MHYANIGAAHKSAGGNVERLSRDAISKAVNDPIRIVDDPSAHVE